MQVFRRADIQAVFLFALALVLAPVVATMVLSSLALAIALVSPGMAFFAVLFVGLSIPYGFYTYALFGGPTFAVLALAGCRNPLWYGLGGAGAHALSLPFLPRLIDTTGNLDPSVSISLVADNGWVFAPLWGVAFGVMIHAFFGKTRDRSAQ